jgi:hypothetical protein
MAVACISAETKSPRSKASIIVLEQAAYYFHEASWIEELSTAGPCLFYRKQEDRFLYIAI